MSKFKDDKPQEEINITTNTQYLNEKSLEKSKDLSEYVFILFSSAFTSSILVQIIRLIPNSYRIAMQIPIIVAALFVAINMILYLNNKKFSLKVYLLMGIVVIGLVIGL